MSAHTSFGWSTRRHPMAHTVQAHRAWWFLLLLIAWWWLFEIALIVGLVLAYRELSGGMPGWAAGLALAAPLAALVAVPWTRRQLIGWSWCAVTRHRLRSFFTAVRLTNGNGRLPWLVFVRPTPAGERALCLMVAGLSYADLTDRNEAIAAACWAREARVTRSGLLASLLWIHVTRRDPRSVHSAFEPELVASTPGFGRRRVNPAGPEHRPADSTPRGAKATPRPVEPMPRWAESTPRWAGAAAHSAVAAPRSGGPASAVDRKPPETTLPEIARPDAARSTTTRSEATQPPVVEPTLSEDTLSAATLVDVTRPVTTVPVDAATDVAPPLADGTQ